MRVPAERRFASLFAYAHELSSNLNFMPLKAFLSLGFEEGTETAYYFLCCCCSLSKAEKDTSETRIKSIRIIYITSVGWLVIILALDSIECVA